MIISISALGIIGIIALIIFVLVITFFILMAEGVIKRTDTTVKIEHAIEDVIGGFFKIFLHGFGGAVNKGIQSGRLKFRCKHCGYLDDINREYCLNCLKNDAGFTIDEMKPFKCRHCHNRFEKPFRYCPKCSKDEKGHSLGVNL